MKKLFLLLFLTVSISTIGQNKIEGVGKYKINKMTIVSLQNIINENNFILDSIKSYNEYSKFKKDSYLSNLTSKKVYIAEVFSDTIKKYNSPPNSSLCKMRRVFYIPEMEISKIQLKDTYLTFYNDTLISVDIKYNDKITEAFTLKYGQPEIESNEETINCIENSNGKTIEKTEKMYYQNWENEDIKCTAALGFYYNDKCEQTYLSYIMIYLKGKKEEIRACDKNELEQLTIRKNKRKKSQLEEF